MSSPNHKTAADAIQRRPAKSRKSPPATIAATKPSRRSSSPPWPGMMWLESLTPKRRFTADSKRSPSCETTESAAPSSSSGPALPRPNAANPAATTEARGKAADRAGPGLLRADPRPQLWPADAAAGEIAADIGHPHDQQDEHQRDESLGLIEAHQHRCDLGRRGIDKSRRSPDAPLRRRATQRRPARAPSTTSDSIDPSRARGKIRPCASATTPRCDHARLARERRRSSAIRHTGRSAASVTSAVHSQPPA